MLKKSVFAALAFLVALPASGLAFEVGAKGMYWMPRLTGEMALDNEAGAPGTIVDLKDDLEIEDKGAPGGEVFLGLGDHHLALSAVKIALEGDAVLTKKASILDQSFASGERVKTEIDLTMADLYYQYDFIDLENPVGGFSMGPVLQVKYVEGNAKVASVQTPANSDDKDFTAALPMVGLGLHAGILLDLVEARARVAGMSVRGNTVVDGYAEVLVTPFPFLDVGAGYRYLKIDIDEKDVLFDIQDAGPYVTLIVSI